MQLVRRSTCSEYKAGGAENLEGFLFPATYELKRGANVKRPGRQAAGRVQGAVRDGRHALREGEEPDAVRRPDHRVDGRARGRGRQGPPADRVGDLQPPQGRDPARASTRRSASRPGNWTEPLQDVRARSRLAVQHAHESRACRRARSATRGSSRSRPRRTRPSTDYLFFVVKPCGEGEHVFAETDAEFQQDVDQYNAERDRQGGQSPTDC